MEKITKDISEVIIAETKIINDKVRGLNFLETLKENIIFKLLEIINNQKFPIDEFDGYEKQINQETRNFKISINYFPHSLSISKKKIENDVLFICLNETSNFDFFKDDKIFKSILLYKNTGISLPKNTIVNTKYNKNLLLIEISNNENEQILKN